MLVNGSKYGVDEEETSRFVSERDAYINLGNAIIEKAAEDYIDCVQCMYDVEGEIVTWEDIKNRAIKDAEVVKAISIRTKLLAFFKSDWYSTLTTVDPDELISMLDKKALEDLKRNKAEWLASQNTKKPKKKPYRTKLVSSTKRDAIF